MTLRLASTALLTRAVQLTVSVGGISLGALSIPSWGQTASAGVSVSVAVTRSKTMTAPEGVFFKVTDWVGFDTQKGSVDGYDQRQMDLIHIWSFGDPGSSYRVPERLLPEWRDRNTARGPFVAHCYEGHGSFGWALTVIEPSTGRIATASGQIAVADPDVTFAGAGTAYVSQTGDFSDCPAQVPAGQRFRTIRAATASLAPRTAGGRVMLARGQDFVCGSNDANDLDAPDVGADHKGPMHFVAGPGAGSAPRYVADPANDRERIAKIDYSFTGGEYVVSGIDHRGNWDSTTETGKAEVAYFVTSGTVSLFNRCTFDGLNPWSCAGNTRQPVTKADTGSTDAIRAANAEGNAANSTMMVHECFGTNGNNYALFGTGMGKIAVLGAQLTHLENARSGGDRNAPGTYNYSGAIRIAVEWPCDGFFDGLDLFSRVGWSSSSNRNIRAIQPCMRWNTGAIANCFANVQRSHMEGGITVLANQRQNESSLGVVSPMLVEHGIFVASHMTGNLIQMTGGGFAVRNILAIGPNSPRQDNSSLFRRVVDANYIKGKRDFPNTEYPELYLAKVEVTGVTLIDLADNTNMFGQAGPMILDLHEGDNPNPFGEVVEASNIVHRPNRTAPEVPFGPLDATPLWPPRERLGAIVSWSRADGTYPARFHRGDIVTIPYPDGTAYENFVPQGQPTPKSYGIGRPEMIVEHTPAGLSITNTGNPDPYGLNADTGVYARPNGDNMEIGESYRLEIERAIDDPVLYPQYASPADSIWWGAPLAGSAAIGTGDPDTAPYTDIGGVAVRPVHSTVGAHEVA